MKISGGKDSRRMPQHIFSFFFSLCNVVCQSVHPQRRRRQTTIVCLRFKQTSNLRFVWRLALYYGFTQLVAPLVHPFGRSSIRSRVGGWLHKRRSLLRFVSELFMISGRACAHFCNVCGKFRCNYLWNIYRVQSYLSHLHSLKAKWEHLPRH